MYTIESYDLEQIAHDGWGRIGCDVVGFAGSHSIMLYVDIAPDAVCFEIVRKTGQSNVYGYDRLQAELNFATALVAVGNLARDIEKQSGWMTDAYNEAVARPTQIDTGARAREQAVVDAEKEIGAAEAAAILDKVIADRGDGGFRRGRTFSAVSRGTTRGENHIRAKQARSASYNKPAKTLLYCNGVRINRADALATIAKASASDSKFESGN